MLFGYTIDQQLDKRPQHVQFCRRCVVSNQRPRITLDADGICSACRYAEEKHHGIDWTAREKALWALCDRHRSNNGSWDVVVPGSGGKDSFYVALRLKERYGMHPLCVTWAPFEYTEVGWRNFMAWNQQLDILPFFPRRDHHRKLALASFELLGDPWQPFTYGQKSYAMHVALKYGIPLVFYGESGEIEYGGSTKNKERPFEGPEDWDALYFKGAGINELLGHCIQAGMFTKKEAAAGFEFYRPPARVDLERLGIQMHWMSYYDKWIPQENYYFASRYGFEANDERSEGTFTKYASLDDKQDGFHFFLAYMKYGICRATSDTAHEVRDGHIQRDEAVALVRRYDGEFPAKYFRWFIDYLGITESEFWEVVEFYHGLSPHLWEKTEKGWKLLHTVWGEQKGIEWRAE